MRSAFVPNPAQHQVLALPTQGPFADRRLSRLTAAEKVEVQERLDAGEMLVGAERHRRFPVAFAVLGLAVLVLYLVGGLAGGLAVAGLVLGLLVGLLFLMPLLVGSEGERAAENIIGATVTSFLWLFERGGTKWNRHLVVTTDGAAPECIQWRTAIAALDAITWSSTGDKADEVAVKLDVAEERRVLAERFRRLTAARTEANQLRASGELEATAWVENDIGVVVDASQPRIDALLAYQQTLADVETAQRQQKALERSRVVRESLVDVLASTEPDVVSRTVFGDHGEYADRTRLQVRASLTELRTAHEVLTDTLQVSPAASPLMLATHP